MAEQGESSSKVKIGPPDIKRLMGYLDDHFSGITPKEKPLESQHLAERYENWVEHLEVLDEMVVQNYLTRLQKNGIIATLLCQKENDTDHDNLTALYNRGGFEKIAGIFFNKASHDKTPLSVAYLDVDNFKNLNEEKGHGEGDSFLRKLASILEATKRKQDVVCRWGGDEFLLLFNLNEKKSQEIVDRMEKVVSKFINLTYRHLNKTLGFTTGIVAWDGQENLTDFLNRADDNLRELKENKRKTNG